MRKKGGARTLPLGVCDNMLFPPVSFNTQVAFGQHTRNCQDVCKYEKTSLVTLGERKLTEHTLALKYL